MNSQQHSFQGQWITAEEFCNLKPVNVFHRQLEPIEINSLAPKNSHILFRKKFKVKSIEKTYIFISADDYYKLYINGNLSVKVLRPGILSIIIITKWIFRIISRLGKM